MRIVVSSDEVPHLWANQAQSEARNGGRNNFSFRGADLYSYSTVIATIVKRKGKTAAIISDRRYSVTTSGHQYSARSAAQHLTVLHVYQIRRNPKEQRNEFAEAIKHATEVYALARRGPSQRKKFGKLDALIARANAYCAFFGLRQFPQPKDAELLRVEITKANALQAKRTEKLRAKRAKEYAEQQAQLRIELAEKLEAWKRGDDVSISWQFRGLYHHQHMRINGDWIETTNGARVEVEYVRRAAPFVLRALRNGTAWERNGTTCRVGPAYQLDSISADGIVKIGCHSFERAEVERIAGLLGVSNSVED